MTATTLVPAKTARLTTSQYRLPLALITSLFFLWAFGVNLNDILIPHLKAAFGLTDFQSSFIQVAFFGGYFLAAFPAGWLMERIGYKRGILAGLALCATGAFLFVPASSIGIYGFFLSALFVMACGQSFLEVAANPYVTILGPAESSERRLNFAQSFNAFGAVVAMVLGRFSILAGNERSAQDLAAMSPAAVHAYRVSQSAAVRLPYVLIAAIFIFVALLLLRSRLPDFVERTRSSKAADNPSWRNVLAQRHLVKAVVAQFLYVGAQVGVGSFVIRFAQHTLPGMTAQSAWFYLLGHWVAFMVGRFAGSALMKLVPAARLLTAFAAGALLSSLLALFAQGLLPVWALVLIGFFHSIMFPTIFALGIKDLGSLTKRGSSLLVMAIVGGAVFPAIMGRISDASNIQIAFVVPLVCYSYILYFAIAGYKPRQVSAFHAAEIEGRML